MTDANRVLNHQSWSARIKRAMPEPWRTMLLVALTFLAFAFCSTIQFPNSPPDGQYIVTFTASSRPENRPPDYGNDSLPRVTLYLATKSMTWPCLRRPCGVVTARGTYAFLPVDSNAYIHPVLRTLSDTSHSAGLTVTGFVDRGEDSTVTFVLSPGSADSLTLRLHRRRDVKESYNYYVGTTCVGRCKNNLPLRAFAVQPTG
jgi:hypothetical protein